MFESEKAFYYWAGKLDVYGIEALERTRGSETYRGGTEYSDLKNSDLTEQGVGVIRFFDNTTHLARILMDHEGFNKQRKRTEKWAETTAAKQQRRFRRAVEELATRRRRGWREKKEVRDEEQ